MTLLKAIDTKYKGHLFRSRLEARWAVFFDAMGLKWEYEVEGYDLDGVWYLPDFKVKTPQGKTMWIEVKNSETKSDPKFERFEEALILRDGFGEWSRVSLVSGTPLQFIEHSHFCARCGLPSEGSQLSYNGYGNYCGPCDFETPCGGDNASCSDGVLGTIYTPHKGDVCLTENDGYWYYKQVKGCAEIAQQARFEHGAKG